MKFEKILYKNFKTKKNLTKSFHKKEEFLYFKKRIKKIYNMKINILLNKIQKLKND